ILSYEAQPQALDDGLIEAGTPECRGPSEVVLYQRAQEDLLVRAIPIVARRLDGELTLLKNCRDAAGHTYGAQENYEADLARGVWLGVWRAGLAALTLPTIVAGLLTWAFVVVMVPVLLALMLVLALAGFVPGLRWLHPGLGPRGRVLQALLRPLVWVE